MEGLLPGGPPCEALPREDAGVALLNCGEPSESSSRFLFLDRPAGTTRGGGGGAFIDDETPGEGAGAECGAPKTLWFFNGAKLDPVTVIVLPPISMA